MLLHAYGIEGALWQWGSVQHLLGPCPACSMLDFSLL